MEKPELEISHDKVLVTPEYSIEMSGEMIICFVSKIIAAVGGINRKTPRKNPKVTITSIVVQR